MEEQIVDEKVPSTIRTPEVKTSAVDFETGLKHIIGPAVIGMTLGMSAEVFLTPNYAWPSPPQAAIIGAILLSPLLYFILLSDEKSRWWEYSVGMMTPGLFFIMIWFSGWGALFCGAYGPLLIWVWISTSWGQFDLPPFRYGIWHSFAINIGGFAGAILAFNLSL
ncbi:MAG: hypothetical protein P8Q95_06925 [Candidatus Poseidoniaceae archaeon]|nr:hypothetical protein [Candidatus Poseidoniaceae archaeon]